MEILTTQLPSGGYKYPFTSISVSPMTFLEINKYSENCPKNPLEKYLYDIKFLAQEDPKIYDCYVMDIDFLIFLKKLITVNEDQTTYTLTVKCPECGKEIKKKINLEKDIHFKQIDSKIMEGAQIRLGERAYETIIPTVREFLDVFNTYLRYRTVDDLKMIKIISLIKNFKVAGNQIEKDILGATHSDITLLMALYELYFDRLEGIEVTCPNCVKEGRRGVVTMSVDSLVVDFFRDLYNNCPIDQSKILFK